jgi:hypothetical protein
MPTPGSRVISRTGRPTGPQRSYSLHRPCFPGIAASPDALLAALALLDDLDARAAATRVRGRLRELGVTGLPRRRSPATRANLGGLTHRQLDAG